ncbi:MAG: class I fructose-bisphosphate aldolase [Candidatus Nanopelagicales bacterium]|jgi:fructose-bisphosphate aldolase class I|nr:class I fructose-bisphosphate aldolase [Candidatus Nanopelagicales bacterium]
MSTKRPRALYAPARTAHIARRLMGDGRGILSADESISTVSGRFVDESIEPSTRVRRDYRQLLLTAPGLRTTVSGIIVCDETFGQALTTGEQFPEAAAARGILVGIKMDTGPLPSPVVPQGALVTEGLEGLQARLESYATRGAAFAQWRAVFDVATPDRAVIRENAHRMAVYARWCQDADIVPIVEPEVLAAGAHNLDACRQLTRLALTTLFDALAVQGVDLAGVVLKPNFVTPGLASQPLSATTVATETFDVLRETVPSEVPGIAFLSGGHPADAACAYLAALRAVNGRPWDVTFSFGHALVSEVLAIWGGSHANVTLAQRSLLSNCARAAAVSRDPDLSGHSGGAEAQLLDGHRNSPSRRATAVASLRSDTPSLR